MYPPSKLFGHRTTRADGQRRARVRRHSHSLVCPGPPLNLSRSLAGSTAAMPWPREKGGADVGGRTCALRFFLPIPIPIPCQPRRERGGSRSIQSRLRHGPAARCLAVSSRTATATPSPFTLRQLCRRSRSSSARSSSSSSLGTSARDGDAPGRQAARPPPRRPSSQLRPPRRLMVVAITVAAP